MRLPADRRPTWDRIIRVLGPLALGIGLGSPPLPGAWTTVVVARQERVGSSSTVPASVALRFERGGGFEVAAGVTLTILGTIEAPPQRIFSGAGKVVLGPGRTPRALPQWWGATGDGQTDDAAALQAAVDAVGNAGGGGVELPLGTYALGSPLTIATPGLALRGAGRGATLRAAPGFRGTLLRIVQARRVLLEDLTIDGAGTAAIGVQVQFPNAILSRCTLTGTVQRAVSLESFSSRLAHCRVEYNAGDGIWLQGGIANDTHIEQCLIGGQGGHGIRLDDAQGYSTGVFVRGCDLENNAAAGSATQAYAHVSIGGGQRHVRVEGCYFESDLSQPGIGAQRFVAIGAGAVSVAVHGSTMAVDLASPLDAMVHIGQSAAPVTIAECTFSGARLAAIDNDGGPNGGLVVSSCAVLGTGVLLDSGTAATVLPSRACARAHRTHSHDPVSGALQVVKLNAVDFDPLGTFDPTGYQWVVPEDGLYQVDAALWLDAVPPGVQAQLFVFRSGTSVAYAECAPQPSLGRLSLVLGDVVACRAGEALSLRSSHTHGGMLAVRTDQTFLAIAKVGVK